jgi:hypothetical protein
MLITGRGMARAAAGHERTAEGQLGGRMRQLAGLSTRVSVCPAARVTATPLKVVVSFFQTL